MAEKETITLRVAQDKKAALDVIAEGLERDRSYVVNQAIDAYLEAHRWQLSHIEEGLRQAEAGEFASEAEVKAAFDRWRR